jgi:phosphoglycerol transferase MdoB-like AlkP superfamily enzyme
MTEQSNNPSTNEKAGKSILIKILDRLTAKPLEVRARYGVLALVASAAVPLKLLLFYKIIGVTTNFFFVWAVTASLTYLLFTSFRNKWIPAVIYLMLSILMFCDVTYSSFFNRYLSVNMLGAAGFLGDITASIKEVLKPWFFLILADAILVLAALGATVKKGKSDKPEDEKPEEIERTETEDETASKEAEITDPWIEELAVSSDAVSTEAVEITEPAEVTEAIDTTEVTEIAEPVEMIATPDETPPVVPEKAQRSNQRVRKSRREKKRKIVEWFSDHKSPVAALLIICLLVFNVTGSFFITSLSNQEIYSFHVKDIVNKLTGQTQANAGSEYMAAVTDSYETEKSGPLFGVAKGRNLIVIQVESLQNIVLNKTYNGQEITPNLNKLINGGDSIYFDHYYQQIGSGNTSDAEFATNNSIYGTLASYTYKLYANNYFKGLPKLLKEQGYETAVYHAHEDRHFWNREDAYASLGFDTYHGGIEGTDKGQYNMTEWMGWGLTDTEFFKQTTPYITEMKQPFYSFVITLSNHHPYVMLDKYQFIKLLPEDKGTIFGNYLNSAAYTDYAIGQFLQELKDEGLYDNSIIAIYGDHMGLPKTDEEIKESVSRFIGKEYDFDTMMNIPLIINIPNADREVGQMVSHSGGQLDFLPTIAYLMGFDKLDTVYLGHNLLTIDSGFVAEQTYMTKGSYFQDDIIYEMSRDGVFENGRAWNIKTGKSVPVKDCYDGYMKSMGLINTSEYILKNDVLRKIYEDNQDVAAVFSNSAASEMEYPDTIATAGAPDQNLLGTNSLEALNVTYDAGYRNIEINVCWTEDKEAVMLNSWSDLGKYFETDQNSEITLEEFQNLKMKNGLTSMDSIDLIAWLKEHPDVKIYAQAERSEDYFMKCMESYAGSIMDQFVAEVPGMVEYSGLYPSILNIDTGGNSVDQLKQFIELNNVPAVTMSKEAAAGKNKELLNEDCISYVRDGENGLLVKNK